MIFFYKIIFIVFLLVSTSCDRKDSIYSSIKISDAVLVKPVILRTDKLHAEIYDIRILDSVLVLRSNDGRGCLQLFDKLNFKFLKTNGIIGRGPGELKNDAIEIKTIQDSLYIFQLTTNEFSIYNINAFINDSLPLAERTIKFEKYNGNFDIFPMDGYFVSRPTIKNRIALYNSSGQHLKDFTEYPYLGDNIDQITHDLAFRFFSLTEPKPDLSMFVSLTFLGGIIEIFNIKDGSINKIVERRYLDPNLQNGKDPGSIIKESTNMGFYGVYVTDDFIYASYSGLNHRDYRENNILLNYVAVFDWTGNIKKLYKVEGGLLDLAVDEVLNRIYIVTKNSEGEEIVGYFNI